VPEIVTLYVMVVAVASLPAMTPRPVNAGVLETHPAVV